MLPNIPILKRKKEMEKKQTIATEQCKKESRYKKNTKDRKEQRTVELQEQTRS